MKSKILTSVSLSPEVGCPPNFWTNSRWNHLVFEGCPPHSDCNCGTGGCEGIEDSGRFHLQYLGPRWLKHREIDVLCLEKFIFILSWVIKHPGGSCSPSHQPPEDLLSAHPCERPAVWIATWWHFMLQLEASYLDFASLTYPRFFY